MSKTYNTNSITMVGNLTRDPELSYTNSNTPVCKFSIANNQGDEVTFINVVSWNKTAQACSQFLNKGSKVCVTGRLSIRRFTTKDGQNATATEIIALSVEFLSSPQQGGSQQPQSNQQHTGKTYGQQPNYGMITSDVSEYGDNEEVPF